MSHDQEARRLSARPEQPFRPWMGDFKAAALIFLAAVALGWEGIIDLSRMPSSGLAWVFLFLAVVLWGLVLHKLRRGMARFHGKKVEHRAVRDLSRLLGARYEVRSGSRTRYGDIDAQVRDRETRQKWSIEIKSQRAVRVHMHVFGDDTLSSPSSHLNSQIPGFLAQARRNGAASDGSPVLWFPRVKNHSIGQVHGVLVVTGPAEVLVRACGL